MAKILSDGETICGVVVLEQPLILFQDDTIVLPDPNVKLLEIGEGEIPLGAVEKVMRTLAVYVREQKSTLDTIRTYLRNLVDVL